VGKRYVFVILPRAKVVQNELARRICTPAKCVGKRYAPIVQRSAMAVVYSSVKHTPMKWKYVPDAVTHTVRCAIQARGFVGIAGQRRRQLSVSSCRWAVVSSKNCVFLEIILCPVSQRHNIAIVQL